MKRKPEKSPASENDALRAVRRALRWLRKAENALRRTERAERRAAVARSDAMKLARKLNNELAEHTSWKFAP